MSNINAVDQPAYRDPTRDFSGYETSRDQIIFFADDFLGADINLTDGPWNLIDQSAAGSPTLAVVDGVSGGILRGTLASTSEAETLGFDWNDIRTLNIKKPTLFEARVAMSVAPSTNEGAYWGLTGDQANGDFDNYAEGAVFKLAASLAVVAESDDTTNDNNDVSTGQTMVAGTFQTFQIDTRDLRDVKFYIDGARVAQATTFDMSNLTDAEAMMQPTFAVFKSTGTGVPAIDVDYVKVWQER